jgi:hypothetical protein
MSEWWTYRLESFLLFSDRAYWRLFELHNAAVWPAQLAALLLGAVIFALVLRPRPWSGRVIAPILAVAWIFAGWTFLWNSYASINWATSYVAPVFVFEGLLLAWIGGIRDQLPIAAGTSRGRTIGLALLAYGVAVHPLVAVIAGRPVTAAEVFGIVPDPTAMGTLGLLVPTKASWLLFLVPLAWCVVSWATLYTMGAWEAWLPLGAGALASAGRAWRSRSQD